MKKIFAVLAVSLMFAAANLFAQPAITVGMANSTEFYKVGNNSSQMAIGGFFAGADYIVELSDYFRFRPGIQYQLATRRAVADFFNVIVAEGRRTDHYINVPLMFDAVFEPSNAFKLFIFGGPTLTMGLSSKLNNYNYYAEKVMNPFNLSLGVGAGAEVSEKIRISVGYDWGLLNLSAIDGANIRHNMLKVGVAFIFD